MRPLNWPLILIVGSLCLTSTVGQNDNFLRFSDLENLPGVVEREDDTFFGPISVSEGNGFIFAGEHREIYIGSNGYFTFDRGVTDYSSEDFDQTDNVVAPFWGDVDITVGGNISFQVYTSLNGSAELDSVSQVIRNVNGDTIFSGTWMVVAQWTEVAQYSGNSTTNNTFEGILITDGNSTSYAAFIYRCGAINWADNAVVGYRADSSLFYTTPASFSNGVLMLGCNSIRTYPWENLIYKLTEVPPVVIADTAMQIALETQETIITFDIQETSADVDISWSFQLVDSETPVDITDETALGAGTTTLSYSVDRLSLTLGDIMQDAAGTFCLTATNLVGVARNCTYIDVQAAPRFVQGPADYNVVLDSTSSTPGLAEFTCVVYAIPLAEITWQYTRLNGETTPVDDDVLRAIIFDTDEGYQTESVLTFMNVDFVDRGKFDCSASNTHDSISDTAQLNVYVTPEFNLIGAPREPLKEGDQLQLNCSAIYAYPEPNLVWLLNGSTLLSSSRVDITNTVTQDETSSFFSVISVLTIGNSLAIDAGRYTCRADLIPNVDSPRLDASVTVQARNECVLTEEPQTTPCVNGQCVDQVDTFFCMCFDGFTGPLCDERVVTETAPRFISPPGDTQVRLGQTVNLTCITSGVPTPTYTWFKDRRPVIGVVTPYFYFPAVQVDDRGYYECSAANTLGSIRSDRALLSLEGVRQYEASVQQPRRSKRQEVDSSIEELINNLVGRPLGDTGATIFSITPSPSDDGVSLLITLATNSDSDVSSGGLTSTLSEDLTAAADDIGLQVGTITRYDACNAETIAVVGSDSLAIDWPETELGETVILSCPCGTIDTRELSAEASRVCGGTYSEGVDWTTLPNDAECRFDNITLQLCEASTLAPEEAAQEVADALSGGDIGTVDYSVATGIIVNITDVAAEDPTVRDDYLTAIDELLQVDQEVVLGSQAESGASEKILESLDLLADTVVLEQDQTSAKFTQRRFAVQVEELESLIFQGLTFSVNVDIEELRSGVVGFTDNNINTGSGQLDSAASISLPPTAVDGETRVSFSVFADDTLFQDSNQALENFTVGSLIISSNVQGRTIENLADPIQMRFEKTMEAIENGTNASCVFWDTSRIGGAGFSGRGCVLVEEDETSVSCECDHLTSFAVLFDVSPQLTRAQFGVEVITYIGLAVSIIALVLTILTYLLSKKLRNSDAGRLLLNLSGSLLGLYIAFIFSSVAPDWTRGACGFFSAVLHYFMLAYFFWTSAEALFLYFKLVKIFTTSGFFISNYVYISMAAAWISPVIIVVISLAGYQYYVNDTFCRPTEWPFWFGFLVPFGGVYIFNWIMFIIIMLSLVRHAAKFEDSSSETRAQVRKHLFIAMVLSLLFGLGWIFGLLGTASLPQAVHVPAQYIFSIFIGLQGVFMFILHAIRSPDSREEWRRWWYILTCRAETYRVLHTSAIIGGTMRGTKKPQRTISSSSTSVSESFRKSPAPETELEKLPLSPVEEKEEMAETNKKQMEETALAIDTVIENPGASSVDVIVGASNPLSTAVEMEEKEMEDDELATL